jgi:two-component system LytT family response regulator
MKAVAIDDEPIALDVIRSHAANVSFVELQAVFTNPFQALEFIQTTQVDLIFLDIKMPDMSGIEFYKSLSKKPLLIFTTAYSEHAVTSFEMDAVDYLLKPFSLSRFIKACNKAHELYLTRNQKEGPDHIFIKSGYGQEKISFSDILYVEAAGNYVTIYLGDKKILSRSTIQEMLSILPKDQFIRVHRSYIVAAKKIEKVDSDQINLGGNRIPVSKAYRAGLLSAIKGLFS